jgi:hypothetical protein
VAWVSVNAKATFWMRREMSALSVLVRLGEEVPDNIYSTPDHPTQQGLGDLDEDLEEPEEFYRRISLIRNQNLTAASSDGSAVPQTLPHTYFRE